MTDMLRSLLPYVDKHHALALLSFYAEKGYDVSDAMNKVVATTALQEDWSVKPEHEKKIKATAARAQPALDAFFDKVDDDDYTYRFKLTATEVDQMRTQSELSYEYLSEKKGITKAVLNAVKELAFLYYDKASYGDTSELLSLCQCVSGFDLPTDTILWGKLLCDTFAINWQSAIDIAAQIRANQNIDDDEVFRGANVSTVRARAWLLHWVLFPFFKGGIKHTIQLLYYIFDYRTDNVYQSVVETACPHLLRYICAAALLNHTRHTDFRNTTAMAENIYEYSDPLTQLMTLIKKPAFDEALALLPEVRKTLQGDYFLADFEDEIINNAKCIIFQKYMSLHSVVSIAYVAEKLDIEKSEAEVWLANLISDSKQRAKVDSVNEQLNVESQTRSVESIVYEKLESASRK